MANVTTNPEKSHVHLGCAYDAAEVRELAAELKRRRDSAKDFILPADRIAVRSTFGGELTIGFQAEEGEKWFSVGDVAFGDFHEAEAFADELDTAHEAEGAVRRSIEVHDGPRFWPLTGTARSQLHAKAGVPVKYSNKLSEKMYGELIESNFDYLMKRDNRRWMLRLLDGKVRAVLSDSYKILDNYDLFLSTVEVCQSVNAELWKARISDDHFDILAVAPHISGEVRTDRPFDPGDGWRSRWYGDAGDVQNAALRITHSETGRGSAEVWPTVFRRVCQNFNCWGDVLRCVHIGSKKEEGIVFENDTVAAEANAVRLKIRDYTKTVFDPQAFASYIEALNGATQQPLGRKSSEVVERLQTQYQFSDARAEEILGSLLGSGDVSRYGLAQAVTDTGRRHDGDDPEFARDAEQIGGAVLSDDKVFAGVS